MGGLLPLGAAFQYAAAIVVYIVLFYIVFRSGLNQRAADPSLTFYMILASLLRSTDVFARFGGEEFLLLLPETDLRGARGLAERVRIGASRLAVEGLPADFRLTLSAGVAQFRADESVEGLLKRADVALYRAKESSRNRVEVEEAPIPQAAG